MKHIKKFENYSKNFKKLKDIIGDSEINNITNKNVEILLDNDYSYNEISDYYIEEIDSYSKNIGIYNIKTFTIFEHGNWSGHLDIEIIFIDNNPIFAILCECECKIKGNTLFIYEDNNPTIKFRLKSKNDIKGFNEGFREYDIQNYKNDNLCLDFNGNELKVGDTVRTVPNQDAFDMESADISEYNEEIFVIGKIEKFHFGKLSQYKHLKGIYKVFYEDSGTWFYNIECEKISK